MAIRAWNINGSLHEIDLVDEVKQSLEAVDVMIFVHTGATASSLTPVLHGFRKVACSPRSHDPAWGGVSIYSRTEIRVTLLEDNPAWGTTWVRVHAGSFGHPDIILCGCYIPPQASSYFRHEDGGLDFDGHLHRIREGVAKYMARGDIVIAGDLNARTGRVPDTCDHRDLGHWAELALGGVPVPGDLITAQYKLSRHATRRNNQDSTTNSHGRALIQLCKEHGLVILNGRVPGDEGGAFTYFRHGKTDMCSTIDYFVCSPSLVYDDTGVMRLGVHMHVPGIREVPRRPDGGRYDHVPITLSIPGRGHHSAQRGSRLHGQATSIRGAARWRDRYAVEYPGMLVCCPHIVELRRRVRDCHDVDEADRGIGAAVEEAINRLTDPEGRPRNRGCGRPVNPWFDDRCATARARYKAAVRSHGVASDIGNQLLKEYRGVTRGAKRAWAHKQEEERKVNMYGNPKAFWGPVRRKGKVEAEFKLDDWVGYFTDLFTNPKTGDDAQNGQARGPVFPDPTGEFVDWARSLNDDIQISEVLYAMEKSANGKAAGVDGVCMEFLKKAVLTVKLGGENIRYNILAGDITHLFNLVLRNGYPKRWSTTKLVPVPKPKGDPNKMDDYRGISVSNSLAKLYSLVMLDRLDAWAEHYGFRAQGQAGFRHGRGTQDNSFVLHHIIEKCAAEKKAVYVAFIDFRKAYDLIDRNLLWDCLRSMGVHGDFLNSIRDMYKQVNIKVCVNGDVSESFQSGIGVKQGDPLSPLLFGLFIDRLEKFLEARLPHVGMEFRNVFIRSVIRVLLYADDLVLVAETPTELQHLLDALRDFCAQFCMEVNVKKSEVVIFNKRWCTGYNWQFVYDGFPLEVKDSFIYLGTIYEDVGGTAKAADRSFGKGRSAYFAMLRKCTELGIHNVHLKCHLFDHLVAPIMCYGCEIWGPGAMRGGKGLDDSGYRKKLETFHRKFLKLCLGVRSSIPDVALMYELDRSPLFARMLKQVMGFWNRIQHRKDDDLVKIALHDNWHMASHGLANCWVANLDRFMSTFDINILTDMSFLFDIDEVMTTIVERWWADHAAPNVGCMVRNIPDNERKGFRTLTYFKWFAADSSNDRFSTFWYNLNRFSQIQIVARFRLGSHDLEIDKGRRAKPCIRRSERKCKLCNLDAREDELHVMHCPVYFEFRAQFPRIFVNGWWTRGSEDCAMRRLMNAEACHPKLFWHDMAAFLKQCWDKRQAKSIV